MAEARYVRRGMNIVDGIAPTEEQPAAYWAGVATEAIRRVRVQGGNVPDLLIGIVCHESPINEYREIIEWAVEVAEVDDDGNN